MLTTSDLRVTSMQNKRMTLEQITLNITHNLYTDFDSDKGGARSN